MKKDYQRKAAAAVTGNELGLPDAVSVAMAEIGGAVKEGLLALAVATGLQVMTAMMEESVTAVAGPKGRQLLDRTAVRHGTEAGSVVLGGRRVPVRRPRVRATDGSGELPVESYDVFSGSDLLEGIALERMMAKLSTRRYCAGLEPVGAQVEATARSTSKSAVSRRFVARTETALAECRRPSPGPCGPPTPSSR
jgi:putative transposase